MGPHWLALLGTLCLLGAARSAAVPTQDTMVVARSDDATTISAVTEAAAAVETTTVVEATSEGPQPPVKLTEMEVVSEVTMRYAQTAVVARMRNPGKRAREAHFRVLLPETAFISGFVMTLDGKSYKAYVKEKEEAKQIYQDAISQGLGAAHVEAKARDSNHFTVSVNIEPQSSAVFNLTYEELLVRRNGVYNHAVNLHPGALVPKLTVTVHIKETEAISELRVPEIRTGNEIDATKDDAQNTQATIVKSSDGREATITFKPDLQEQEQLIQIYTEKSKDSAAVTSHSYSWSLEPEQQQVVPEGVLGQFVVQYDVVRPKDGEVLINDGYFVHFFAPTELPPLSKHVVFVLDTSGSMMDRKIVQLRDAMKTILGELNPGDYFSIVEFESTVTVHDLKEAEGEPPKRHYYHYDYERKTTLVPPSPATPENIEKAKLIVSWLNASGGTNIGQALDVAVQLINKGVDWKLPAGNATTAATTPVSEVSTSEPTSDSTSATEASVNTADKKETKTLEPIIIFLTDGDPTVGETNPKRIITAVAEKNYGPNKATIFSLAFGEDADRKFLRKVSLRNGGFMRHIYEAADAALQLRDFYRQISSPLLADVTFNYPKDQVKEGTLTKHKFRTFYGGSEVVVAGRVAGAGAGGAGAGELAPRVVGWCGVRDGYGRIEFESQPKAPVAQPRSGYFPLERLWAYLSIKQLLDERDAAAGDDVPADQDKEHTPEKKALALALKYSFVTPLTSLVVVKPNETNAVNAESVDKTSAGAGLQGYTGLSLASLPAVSSLGYGAGGMAAQSAFGYPASPGIAGFSSSAFNSRPSYQAQLPLARPNDFVEEAEELDYFVDDGHSYTPHLRLASVGQYPLSLNADLGSGYSAMKVGGQYHSLDSYPSTPMLYVPTSIRTTTTPATPSGLSEFRLQNYTWVEALLDRASDSLVLDTNGTTHNLKLSKEEVPKESSGDAQCASAVDGGAGVCVYLTRCDSARHITVDVYKTTYCTVTQGYAGVCCQQSKVDLSA